MRTSTIFSGICGCCIRLGSVACLIVAMLAGMAINATAAEGPLPPDAQIHGRTLAEWLVLHNEWTIATGLGGDTSLPDTVDGMQFLPHGFGPGDFEFDVRVPAGTGLVTSSFFAFGEIYEDLTFDDPEDEFIAFLLDLIFHNRNINVWFDGKLVQSGTPADLVDYTYGPSFFDEPIVYAETGENGAIAAIWTIGVGALYPPLEPGEHTLKVESDGPVFGANTFLWNITVEK